MLALTFPKEFPGFGKTALFIALNDLTHYVLFAGLAWLLGYVLFRGWWHGRKIIQEMPSRADMRREAMWSALTVVIYGLVGSSTLALKKLGWTQIYTQVDDFGWGWFWGSIVVVIFVHDAYFYWTHRLIHHPRLFRFFHGVHHESHNPSPLGRVLLQPGRGRHPSGDLPAHRTDYADPPLGVRHLHALAGHL